MRITVYWKVISFFPDFFLFFSFSAQLSVPLKVRRIGGGGPGVSMTWDAVTVQDAQPIYRLFMDWRHKGKVHVRLLCETNQTSCEFKGKLPFPNLMYVSVVMVKQPHTFQAGNIGSYPTKKVFVSGMGRTPTKPGNNIRIPPYNLLV